MSQLKVAIIADMIASKKMKERPAIQNVLAHIIDDINDQYSSRLESNLTITLGDEFQGIVSDIETAFYFVDLITLRLQLLSLEETGEEATLRWGIGIGELTTPIQDKRLSIGSDGPAYWHAREAIEGIHGQNDYGQSNEQMITGKDDSFYNSIIRLQNVIRNGWTTTQKETAYYVLKTSGYKDIDNQAIRLALNEGLAKSFSNQTISKRLISTNIKQYTQSRRLLAERIEEWRHAHVN